LVSFSQRFSVCFAATLGCAPRGAAEPKAPKIKSENYAFCLSTRVRSTHAIIKNIVSIRMFVNRKNFNKVIKKHKGKKGFLLCKAEWCHYCIQFAPDWEKFCKEANDHGISTYTYDCSKRNGTPEEIEESKLDTAFANKVLGLKSYPTIYYICNEHGNINMLDSSKRSLEYLRKVAGFGN
jgi:thiol-disulfide isomerase/thioredoxin